MPYDVAILEFDDDVNQGLVVTRVTFRKRQKRRFGDIDGFDKLKSHPLIRRDGYPRYATHADCAIPQLAPIASCEPAIV